MKSVKDIDKNYVMNTYNRYDLEIVEGMGVNCYDVDGKEYIDLSAGIGVNSLGFCEMGWVASVTQQVCKLNHTSNLFYSQPCALLAKALCEKTGYKKVFFSNSGAEANEGAIKLARKYSFDKYGGDRNKVITLVNSFHGRTISTLAATGQDVFHNYFFPFTEGFVYAKANDLQSVEKLADNSVCAIMIELIQGEGGVIALDKEFVKGVAKLCKEKDILFIVDEVQTGVGRTGKFLASEYFNITPDITTLAKGLGGGLPIGAVLAGEKCESVLGFSAHGSTFGGNPIVCAGGNYVLARMDDDFLFSVEQKGEYFKEKLEQIDEIESVSGMGLMMGLKLKTKKSLDVVKEGIKRGVIMLTAKEKVRLLPPLTITYDEIDKAVAIIKSVLND
ncbi:MAG: aspartate aminotransferase family protein [Clostridia bacterium]|nr:aspartate aminotransferase family protein [Clostridia bacterium]MDE7329280.1 aspartate aminotransferase family protein [Clostridia bacterium]